MVNTEEFIKRLEIILEYYSLSASAFADKIGVQRSGLSHLLSGRNKPSLDFIMRIVERYPEVDLYWLLNGKGNFPKDDFAPLAVIQPAPPPTQSNQQEAFDLFSAGDDDPKDNAAPENENIKSTTATALPGNIERIVIFYKDGTFKHYNPQQ